MGDAVAISTKLSRGLFRFLCDVILAGHAMVALFWGWFMPGGFSVDHARFWLNGVLPWVVAVAALSALFLKRIRSPVLAALALLWMAAAISARITFPMTFRTLWLGPVLVGAAIGGLAFAEFRVRRVPASGAAVAMAAVLAAAAGAALPLTQRAGIPDTRPANIALPEEQPATIPVPNKRTVPLARTVDVLLNDGTVIISSDPRTLTARPLLSFQSRSADGCWTLFARAKVRRGPERKIIGATHHDSRVTLSFRDDDRSVLEVDASGAPRITRLEAVSRLPEPVWSHLNTFAELVLRGRGELSVSFSPCPDTRIEIRAMDYPFGKPARFAYVDVDEIFHVVEASSAEKGPFRSLASGPLAKDAPLEMILFDDRAPVFRVTLEDWAAQAGRQISPTAGWRVPVNAIEFSLQAKALAQVFITLAGTSVGRGYESVGHAAGVYRNRMFIETLEH